MKEAQLNRPKGSKIEEGEERKERDGAVEMVSKDILKKKHLTKPFILEEVICMAEMN